MSDAVIASYVVGNDVRLWADKPPAGTRCPSCHTDILWEYDPVLGKWTGICNWMCKYLHFADPVRKR